MKTDRSYKIVSLAFTTHEGKLQLAMASCFDCSRNIVRHGIKTVYYSNCMGQLERCNSQDLVKPEMSTPDL